MKLSERVKILKVLLCVAVLFIATCSGSDSSSNTKNPMPVNGGNCLANGTAVSIIGNHGHVLTVSSGDIAADVDKPYDIQGSASHTHTVNLVKTDFDALKVNQGIQVVSSLTLGHTHTIIINCQ
jgi:hypothetical protein